MRELLTSIVLFISTVFFTTRVFAYPKVNIYPSGEPQIFNLVGEDGPHGKDGSNAFALDCSDGKKREGRKGEDGSNGEEGGKGIDAFIYYEQISDLKNITLFQKGGNGGAPGLGGAGTAGCHGGDHGHNGHIGSAGPDGDYGDIYLVNINENFKKGDSTRVISLKELAENDIELSKPKWKFHNGALSLFSRHSDIKPYFWSYEGLEEYTVTLRWNVSSSVEKYGNTKLAFSIKGDSLSVTTYSGPIIDYRVWKEGQGYVLEILDANSIDDFKNLSFGKLRGLGEDLVLEVKEKYSPQVKVSTKFVISLFGLDPGREVNIGQFTLDKDQVEVVENTFYLKIGSLNYPSEFKKRGTKIKVHLSIYRSAREQTRVFGLKGIFKL